AQHQHHLDESERIAAHVRRPPTRSRRSSRSNSVRTKPTTDADAGGGIAAAFHADADSARATTATLRRADTTARVETESPPLRSTSAPISAYSNRAAW